MTLDELITQLQEIRDDEPTYGQEPVTVEWIWMSADIEGAFIATDQYGQPTVKIKARVD